jgi:hypothetical protein
VAKRVRLILVTLLCTAVALVATAASGPLQGAHAGPSGGKWGSAVIDGARWD